MLEIKELTDMQLDFLKELTNIGGGNAATALSQIINCKIQMEVPKVAFITYQELFSSCIRMEEEVCAVSIRVHGDAPGNFLFIIKETDVSEFIDMLSGVIKLNYLSELYVSAMQEVGNILCSSYWNALSRLLDLTFLSSVPAFVQDMFGAIMTTAYIESGQYDDTLLFIENIFKAGSARVKAHLFFIPLPGSLEKIISLNLNGGIKSVKTCSDS
ncbi:MAG TPA: chemotaxis protein CheC [Clostridiales bacterium]|nr:chemotaxis protein CheC [Clostridiales bacterium]